MVHFGTLYANLGRSHLLKHKISFKKNLSYI